MRNKLVRIYGHGHLHFITFSCYHRQALLGSVCERNLFVRVLGEVRDRFEFSLVEYVVMPEHVHLLVGESNKGDPSKVVQVLKQTVSHGLRRERGRNNAGQQLAPGFPRGNSPCVHLWQRRFYDFNVWSHKKTIEKLNYMHDNPVTGLKLRRFRPVDETAKSGRP